MDQFSLSHVFADPEQASVFDFSSPAPAAGKDQSGKKPPLRTLLVSHPDEELLDVAAKANVRVRAVYGTHLHPGGVSGISKTLRVMRKPFLEKGEVKAVSLTQRLKDQAVC